MKSPFSMSKENIVTYLTALGKAVTIQYKYAGIPLSNTIKLVIFGGANLARLDMRESTQDVDFMFLNLPSLNHSVITQEPLVPQQQAFLQAQFVVAQKYRLPYQWINDAGDVFPKKYQVRLDLEPWDEFGPLSVFVPSLPCQLALKIVSGRERDRGDVEALRRKLQLLSTGAVQYLMDDFVPQSIQNRIRKDLDESGFLLPLEQ